MRVPLLLSKRSQGVQAPSVVCPVSVTLQVGFEEIAISALVPRVTMRNLVSVDRTSTPEDTVGAVRSEVQKTTVAFDFGRCHTTLAAFGLPLPERTHGLCRPRGGAPEPHTHTPTRVRCLQVGGGLGPARCGGQGERGGCGALANARTPLRSYFYRDYIRDINSL